jgi:A/G-specific adenine glycosylase
MTTPIDGPTIRQLSRVRSALLAWHAEHGLRAPWRESRDPYHCLVAAVMAQQTQMSRVMPSYERFMVSFPTLESLAAASPAHVIRVWAGMGYNQRAVRLHRAAREIAERGWPKDAEALAEIHGIGPFTAAIIASFAFAQSAACVDTNVRRVLGRLSGDETIGDAALQRLADVAIGDAPAARWNQAVMDYGARVCVVRPKCDVCVVASACASRERFTSPRTRPHMRPQLRVAEDRVAYVAGSPSKEPPFEKSTRYYRGRIVDALRALPPGATLPLADLAPLLANGDGSPGPEEVRVLVAALERQGLAAVRDGMISLPE